MKNAEYKGIKIIFILTIFLFVVAYWTIGQGDSQGYPTYSEREQIGLDIDFQQIPNLDIDSYPNSGLFYYVTSDYDLEIVGEYVCLKDEIVDEIATNSSCQMFPFKYNMIQETQKEIIVNYTRI